MHSTVDPSVQRIDRPLSDASAVQPQQPDADAAAPPELEVLIIGAGFGGIGAAIQLQRLGIHSFLIVERADDLGGTWHANTYPGLTVDIPCHSYAYSFEPNPDWSRMFAPGAEIKAYANDVATKYRLREHMRFGCDVERTEYDEAGKYWTAHIRGQAPIRARVLVAAVGYLSRPKRPSIPGLESFAGKVIHTAAWDHDYDLQGRRAAVIGTGATSVQLLPEIAPKLAQLDVYQRTPVWVGPKRDFASSADLRAFLREVPLAQRLWRLVSHTILELMTWFGVTHYKLAPFFMRLAMLGARMHMHHSIKDPELRRKLTPSYGMGCKRPTISNSYYPVFNRDNVELVTEPIARIEPDGVVTQDGRKRRIDTLILATGFNIWETDGLVSIRGVAGRELAALWQESGYRAYEGITIPGFPNLFYLPAPYSYTGLSYFFTIEGEMKHMARCLTAMKQRGAASFEVTESALVRFVARMKRQLGGSVFVVGDCTSSNSYYFDPHGEPTLMRPTPVVGAHLRHATFPLSDYHFG